MAKVLSDFIPPTSANCGKKFSASNISATRTLAAPSKFNAGRQQASAISSPTAIDKDQQMSNKIAVQCSDNLHECVALPSGKRMSVDAAGREGYLVTNARSLKGEPAKGVKGSPSISAPAYSAPSYAAQLRALPEALNRQSAASALAADHTINTLPIAAAASLLRGLPIESEGNDMSTTTQLSAEDHAMFKRKLGLRMASLRTSADHGSDTASAELKALNTASRTVEITGTSWGFARSLAGLDARATIKKILDLGGPR